MTEFSIVAVFFVGLLGGVHCLGMCGSIVGVYGLTKVGYIFYLYGWTGSCHVAA